MRFWETLGRDPRPTRFRRLRNKRFKPVRRDLSAVPPMKVTMIICDRCDEHLRKVHRKETKLELTLKYHNEESDWSLFREREKIHLCPSCRDAFANWLGTRGNEIEGLHVDSGPEAYREPEARTDGEAEEQGEQPEPEEPLARVDSA